MPFATDLRGRCIAFPNAVSPGSWTLPSHASLFTGLYPWEHGVHLRAQSRLDSQFMTLAEMLKEGGYATASLSANGLLCPVMGLLRGFDAAVWGEFWERYIRFSTLWKDYISPRRKLRPTEMLARSGSAANPFRLLRRGLSLSPRLLSTLSGAKVGSSIARCWNLMNLVGLSLDPETEDCCSGKVSPWIERSLEIWLRQQRKDQPVFCFVNLIDAHEPYLAPLLRSRGLAEWWRRSAVRDDPVPLLAGLWHPTQKELQSMHDSYCRAIQSMDGRLRAIIEAFKESNRWENTLMFVTADHGQAFGEHGFLGHGLRVDEQVVRIPLWMRLPRDESGGSVGTGWASLIDLVPTTLRMCGLAERSTPYARSLFDLLDKVRPEPLFAVSAGLAPSDRLREIGTDDSIRRWDVLSIAAYQGDTKVIVEPDSGRVRSYRIHEDPLEARDLAQISAAPDSLVRSATRVGRYMSRDAQYSRSPEVVERLRSWGYA